MKKKKKIIEKSRRNKLLIKILETGRNSISTDGKSSQEEAVIKLKSNEARVRVSHYLG